MLHLVVDDSFKTRGSGREKVGGSRNKLADGKKKTEQGMPLNWVGGLKKLIQVASVFDTNSFWLR